MDLTLVQGAQCSHLSVQVTWMTERAVEFSKVGSPMSETQLPTRIKVPYRTSRASHGEGNGTLLQYSCLENPMDGGAWTGESQGWGSLVGCRLWGHKESDPTEVT